MVANQLNIEYVFRYLYECFRGACYGTADYSWLAALLAHIWIWVTVIGYLLAILAFFVIIYATRRLFQLRESEEKFYATLLVNPKTEGGTSARWEHIESLASGTSTSEWREAIIEADIMLDDMLTEQGYVGVGVGEKLKAANPEHFHTLQDAWEAHKVRNQIAHEGSALVLSEALVRRTIARYSAVFHEFKVI